MNDCLVRAVHGVDVFQGRKLSALAQSYYPFGMQILNLSHVRRAL